MKTLENDRISFIWFGIEKVISFFFFQDNILVEGSYIRIEKFEKNEHVLKKNSDELYFELKKLS